MKIFADYKTIKNVNDVILVHVKTSPQKLATIQHHHLEKIKLFSNEFSSKLHCYVLADLLVGRLRIGVPRAITAEILIEHLHSLIDDIDLTVSILLTNSELEAAPVTQTAKSQNKVFNICTRKEL